MADITVAHPTLVNIGGGSPVCFNIIQALQEDHNITLVTMSIRDIDDINDDFGTNVEHINIHLSRTSNILRKTDSFEVLKRALFARSIKKADPSPDLVISTFWDIALPYDSITYIHYPSEVRYREHWNVHRDGLRKLYFKLCNSIRLSDAYSSTYITNSKWTADHTYSYLGTKPKAVYPPVVTEDLRPIDWHNRKEGILSIGRVSPEKNILRNIDIAIQLTKLGHDIDYRIVGPFQKDNISYIEKVKSRVCKYDFIKLEGKVSRRKLADMMSRYKYGLHGHDSEHFGIVVAELVAGGAIPFVPNDGGQCEIVNHCEDVVYRSIEDAVDKMDRVMNSELKQQQIQKQLPSINKKFGPARFRNEIKDIVDKKLAGSLRKS